MITLLKLVYECEYPDRGDTESGAPGTISNSVPQGQLSRNGLQDGMN